MALRIHPDVVAIHVAGDNAEVHSEGIIANDETKIDLGERFGRGILGIFES